MRAEFCIFESNAPGLKANFYEPYVDMPSVCVGGGGGVRSESDRCFASDVSTNIEARSTCTQQKTPALNCMRICLLLC